MDMKFVKGMIMGGIVSAGAMMLYSDGINTNKKKMIKKSKQFAKKIGMM